MGFKNKLLSKLAISNKRKKLSNVNDKYKCSKGKFVCNITLKSVLDNISVFNTNNQTPKSNTNLVYNLGKNVDIVIGFALNYKGNIINSKGLSTYEGKKSYSVEEWDELSKTDIPNIRIAAAKKDYPVFIVENRENVEQSFICLLRELNKWANKNYPLTVGIDCFNTRQHKLFDMSALSLYDTVCGNSSLSFVFYYYCYSREMRFLNIPKENEDKAVVPSDYFEGNSVHERYLNSMIELRGLLQRADGENAKIYKQALTGLCSRNLEISSGSLFDIYTLNMNIYDNIQKQFLFKTYSKYRMGYCLEEGGKYVEFNDLMQKFETTERFILVASDTKIMLNGELASKINKIDLENFKPPKIKWLDGVPGSGKTDKIISQHKPGEDLVLTQTKGNLKDIRDKVLSTFGQGCSDFIYTKYRTVASYIINYRNNLTYDRVFFDEALMMHSGYLGYIAILTKAKEIIIFGDSKQIPYIERCPLKTQWEKITDMCIPDEYENISRRCPMDVCYALSEHYDGIKTCNKVIKSILPIGRDGEFFKIAPDALVLTFTQKEKEMVKNMLRKNVNLKILTVHEAQGLTAKRVLLIRIDSSNKEIYYSIPHSIVAISRHTEEFKYLTTGHDDAVENLIRKSHCMNINTLSEWNARRLGISENKMNT